MSFVLSAMAGFEQILGLDTDSSRSRQDDWEEVFRVD
jgi:hypothetical protein